MVRNDLFMATLDNDAGFDLGDFARKSGKKAYFTWHMEEGGGSINSSPVIKDEHIYIAALDGYLYKIKKSSAELAWKFKAGGMFSDAYPVIKDGIIYLGCYNHNVYAIDEMTGKELWRFRTGGRIEGSAVLPLDDMVIFTSGDYYVYAIHQKTGKMCWAFRTGGWSYCCPTEHEGKIIVSSSDGNLYLLGKDGREIWRFKTGGNIFTQNRFCIHDGVVYFGSDDFNVYGVRLSDGMEVWRYRTGSYVNVVPTIHEGMIYISSDDENLYAVDLATTRTIWKFRMGERAAGSMPVILGNNVIFGSADHNVYCLDAKTGKEVWRFKTYGHIFGETLIDGNRIYVPSYDCHLYCITTDGELVWKFRTSTSRQSTYKYEEETVIEFNAPKFDETKGEKDDRYAVSAENVVSHDYAFKSEYSFKSEYQSKSEYR
ncbi:MAG: PQQ-binding-like beta-propeller repeat protein [Candidatus Aenigmatarchaeota archaeon]